MRHATLQLLLAVVLVGCAEESGILLAVSGGRGVKLDQLEFNVAVERGDRFVLEPAISGQRFGVKGRTLSADPYEHLLREQNESGPPLRVRVLVVGRAGGKDTHLAVTEPPQPFVRGEVVRRALSLAALGDNAGLGRVPSGCLRVWWKEDDERLSRVLGSSTDEDCDGHEAPQDCADNDPKVHPEAPEVCDGKDNNCDGEFYAPSQDCYVRRDGNGTCQKGSRSCDDAQGSGWAEDCILPDPPDPAPQTLCEAYDECFGAVDPLACALSRVKPLTLACVAEKIHETSVLCGGSYRLEPQVPGGPCSWSVVDSGGFELTLSSGGSEPPPPNDGCGVNLVLKEGSVPGGGTAVLVLEAGQLEWRFEVTFALEYVAQCSSLPLSCTWTSG